MTAKDLVAMLEIYGVTIGVTPSRTRLDVTGPVAILEAAAPMLMQHRGTIIEYLLSPSRQKTSPAAARGMSPGRDVPVSPA